MALRLLVFSFLLFLAPMFIRSIWAVFMLSIKYTTAAKKEFIKRGMCFQHSSEYLLDFLLLANQ